MRGIGPCEILVGIIILCCLWLLLYRNKQTRIKRQQAADITRKLHDAEILKQARKTEEARQNQEWDLRVAELGTRFKCWICGTPAIIPIENNDWSRPGDLTQCEECEGYFCKDCGFRRESLCASCVDLINKSETEIKREKRMGNFGRLVDAARSGLQPHWEAARQLRDPQINEIFADLQAEFLRHGKESISEVQGRRDRYGKFVGFKLSEYAQGVGKNFLLLYLYDKSLQLGKSVWVAEFYNLYPQPAQVRDVVYLEGILDEKGMTLRTLMEKLIVELLDRSILQ